MTSRTCSYTTMMAGPGPAGRRVREQFGDDLVGATVTALLELSASFADEATQGSVAFA